MLREIRRNINISQKELALRLGISQSYLSELELKKSVPSLDTIKKISNELGICPIRIINFYMEDKLEFNCCTKCCTN